MRSVSEEVAFFNAMFAELQREYAGKYVVIREGRVIASGDTYGQAYDRAVKVAGTLSTFMIARVDRPQPDESETKRPNTPPKPDGRLC